MATIIWELPEVFVSAIPHLASRQCKVMYTGLIFNVFNLKITLTTKILITSLTCYCLELTLRLMTGTSTFNRSTRLISLQITSRWSSEKTSNIESRASALTCSGTVFSIAKPTRNEPMSCSERVGKSIMGKDFNSGLGHIISESRGHTLLW